MLTKSTNPKISYLSRVLALPLMAFLILAFTIKEKNSPKTENKLENVKSFPVADIADPSLITLMKGRVFKTWRSL